MDCKCTNNNKTTEDHGCCPIGSEPQLAANYKSKGNEDKFGDLPVYLNGKGDKWIIVTYDIFGFDGGRTRLICDQLAGLGYNVILPDFYKGKPFQEGQSFDTLPQFLKQFPWDGIEKDLNEHIYPYIEKQGGKTIGALGFCWGGWVNFHAAASGKLKCCATCHPSIRVADMLGESQEELAKAVQCPQMLLSGENDAENVKEGGALVKILEEKFPGKNFVKTFNDQRHGWVNRGDVSNAETARDVKVAMELVVEFFNKNL